MSQEYKSILKAISIFGGTQVIQILVNLIKAKFVAILIGAAGVGLSSMYMSSLAMIITIFGLGLNSSVVRELSKAHDENDIERFSVITTVFRRLLYFLSIIGTVSVIILSSRLSEWAFDTVDKANEYCFLSLLVCFTLLAQGNTAVLVSARRIKETALCTLISLVVNLLTSIPMFYFWGIDGIVPGLLVSAIANYIVTYYFSRRIKIRKTSINKELFKEYSKSLIGLGSVMILASLFGNITVYLINISITRMGGISDLGLFNAGMSITAQAAGLIFAAMGADYYPRLVASLSDNVRMNDTINQQSEILLYIVTPILAMIILLAPVIITVLLSSEFYVIKKFIRILCLGMLLKAASYTLGYVSFAKGDKLIYVFLEGGYGNLANLILSIGMYYLWGLTGLAYSFLLNYFLYMILISIVVKKRYDYKMSTEVKKTLLLSTLSLALLLFLSYAINDILYYITGSLICTFVIIYNVIKINRKTDLFSSIIHIVTNKKKE